MHVIVTGASGFVGRALTRSLAAAGSTGVAVARRTITDLPAGWRYEPREQVLSSPAPGVHAVIHLEARHHQYDAPGARADEFIEANVGNTRAWLDWCTRSGITRFLFYSSVKAVDVPKTSPGGVIDETAVGPGATPYGRSKWQAEQMVASWAAIPGRSALLLRPAVIYGPGNTANIYSMVDAIAHDRFVFVGANDNVKSLVSVRNVAAATVHLLARMEPGCDIYHLVDARRYSIRELAGMIARYLDVRAPRIRLPITFVRPAAWLTDRMSRALGLNLHIGSRLEALCEHADFSPAKLLATGFVHPETSEEGLAEMVKWYRDAPGDHDPSRR